jgi:hypothetical protein
VTARRSRATTYWLVNADREELVATSVALVRVLLDEACIPASGDSTPVSSALERRPLDRPTTGAVLGGSWSMQNGPIVSVSHPGAVHCVTIGISCWYPLSGRA